MSKYACDGVSPGETMPLRFHWKDNTKSYLTEFIGFLVYSKIFYQDPFIQFSYLFPQASQGPLRTSWKPTASSRFQRDLQVTLTTAS